MGDMGEVFNAMREAGKQKRARNRDSSPQILTSAGIEYDDLNCGYHLKVHHKDKVADFWPGTGKWIDRETKHTGRGVKPLIRFMKA